MRLPGMSEPVIDDLVLPRRFPPHLDGLPVDRSIDLLDGVRFRAGGLFRRASVTSRPDDGGVVSVNNVCLGALRLGIIGLSEAGRTPADRSQ